VARCEASHKGYAEHMSEQDPLPDDETDLGDTSEAHDEISPVDLPLDHPGRKEAERQSGGVEGETPGNT
jgi:hypothetical protein